MFRFNSFSAADFRHFVSLRKVSVYELPENKLTAFAPNSREIIVFEANV
jgi:hypothetical protein